MLLITLGIVTIIKLNDKKEVVLDNVKLKEEIKNNNNFALMIEEDGEYVESETFPTSGYVLNETLSGCVDNNGNTLENALTYTNGTINLRTRTNAMCFLYFDIEEIYAAEYLIENVDSSVLWNSTLEDDGYRYVGTDPANYVCFGYDDASEDCDFTSATNTDLYAYRIIGIFEDSEGIQHIKLIKKEIITANMDDEEYGYMWNEDSSSDVNWEDSDLFEKLNGDTFLNNITYLSTGWSDKIENWMWTSTNTQTSYAGSSTENVGADYYDSWPIGIYNSEHEIDTTTGCYQASSVSAINCKTTASYTYPEAKIGLMYASDYALSLGETAVSMTGSTYTNRTTLKTGWMHISNNDSDAYQYEWTSSRFGFDTAWFYVWFVDSNGFVGIDYVRNTYSVRPVFYLTSDVELTGEGTITNPYIITN